MSKEEKNNYASEFARMGGRATYKKYGKKYMSKIGKKGGLKKGKRLNLKD